MEARPIDANALRKRIEEWMQELEQEFTVEYAYMGYALDDVLDYIDTAPTIEGGRSLCCLQLKQRGVIKMEKCCKESRRQRTF